MLILFNIIIIFEHIIKINNFIFFKLLYLFNSIFFSFDLTTVSSSLNNQNYSEYQYFLHSTILDLFNKGMNFTEIANYLNEKGIKTTRGKTFKNAHTHSILKKKRLSDDKFNREFPSEISNCSIQYFDKNLLNDIPT